MKSRLSKLDKIIVGGGSLLIILVFVYAQFLSLTPLKSDLALKQQELQTDKKLLDMMSKKKTDFQKTDPENTSELQKQLPVMPLQEQVLLDLEKAETVSNSQIKTMSFTKDADVTPPAAEAATANSGTSQGASQNQTATNKGTQNQDAQNQTTTAQGTGNQAATQQQAAATVPNGLKKITVQLQVESQTYTDLEKFIETLESLPRIVVVEAINYTGEEEVTSLSQEKKPITYSLTVSAFYMPTLTDLAAQLPKIDAPAPAGKDNPLTQFPATAATQP
ncbi:hypothetical protein PH210_20220 [Paenibacillus sp. BSR1-1]|uniref:hypothetical protein n=1 Tax=Paenibacillus sp. BSR1-1 TaxID=3020845 RepID=UPI0025B2076C|nr:hypothetical protein [Paenibacillus sp. BSR1-1]MDN3018513.1 hypothetical protein [Paenibacillus sp. BSR1-1]